MVMERLILSHWRIGAGTALATAETAGPEPTHPRWTGTYKYKPNGKHSKYITRGRFLFVFVLVPFALRSYSVVD